MHHVRILSSSLGIRGLRCPSLHILECRIGGCISQHGHRSCPRVTEWSNLIGTCRLSSLSRNLKVEARASLFAFNVGSFVGNLTLVVLRVGSINRRSLNSGYTSRENSVSNSSRGNESPVREESTPIGKVSNKYLGHLPRVGNSKPTQISRDQLSVPSGGYYSLLRSFDGSTSSSNRIGHPSSMVDIVINRVNKGRSPLSLEEFQDSLHVP